MCQNLTLKKNESVNNSHSVYFKARLQSLNKRIEQTRAHATRHRASGGTKALSLTNGLKSSVILDIIYVSHSWDESPVSVFCNSCKYRFYSLLM